MEMFDIELDTNFFDKENKEAYLKEKCVSAQDFKLHVSLFNSISKIENDFHKDVKMFNKAEFDDLLYSLNSHSKMSLSTKFNLLRRYCEWAGSESQTDFIPITTYYSKEDLNKFIVKLPRFVTREELYNDIIPCEENAVNRIIPALMYEGIRGKANEELRYLLVKDVDFFNDKIIIRDKEENFVREKKLPHDTMQLLKEAISQTKYYVRTKTGNLEEFDLISNKYVLRTYLRKNDKRVSNSGFDPLTSSQINSKVNDIVDLAGRPSLSPLEIYQSKMLETLYNIEQERALVVNDYKNILEEYGENPTNYFKLKQIYITQYNTNTTDTIRKKG